MKDAIWLVRIAFVMQPMKSVHELFMSIKVFEIINQMDNVVGTSIINLELPMMDELVKIALRFCNATNEIGSWIIHEYISNYSVPGDIYLCMFNLRTCIVVKLKPV